MKLFVAFINYDQNWFQLEHWRWSVKASKCFNLMKIIPKPLPGKSKFVYDSASNCFWEFYEKRENTRGDELWYKSIVIFSLHSEIWRVQSSTSVHHISSHRIALILKLCSISNSFTSQAHLANQSTSSLSGLPLKFPQTIHYRPGLISFVRICDRQKFTRKPGEKINWQKLNPNWKQ